MVLGLVGCKSVNQTFFSDSTNYSKEQEQRPLKFPSHSLALSNRYDIPSIPNDNGQVITEILPPDF